MLNPRQILAFTCIRLVGNNVGTGAGARIFQTGNLVEILVGLGGTRTSN
jgi:hypothetical protein